MKALWRGLQVLAAVFGWKFTLAILGVLALLLVSVWYMQGPIVAVIALLLALMAIRAHDIGEEDLRQEAEGQPFEDFAAHAKGHDYYPPHPLGGNHDGQEL